MRIVIVCSLTGYSLEMRRIPGNSLVWARCSDHRSFLVCYAIWFDVVYWWVCSVYVASLVQHLPSRMYTTWHDSDCQHRVSFSLLLCPLHHGSDHWRLVETKLVASSRDRRKQQMETCWLWCGALHGVFLRTLLSYCF